MNGEGLYYLQTVKVGFPAQRSPRGGERGAAGPWYIRLLNRQEEEGKCLGPDIRPRGTHHPNKPTQLDQPLINGPQEIPKSVVGLIDWSPPSLEH